ncbi:hypothetical protein MKK30_11160 [Lactococcus formosensis]|nr:hypothetical protein [Lactococcus formosensis]MCH1724179.1 hypothetical protein [Lactococcus formosensis]
MFKNIFQNLTEQAQEILGNITENIPEQIQNVAGGITEKVLLQSFKSTIK